MKQFLITGGTGMVGSQLVNKLKNRDVHITILTRSDKQSDDPKISYVNWSKDGWMSQVPDIDVVVNFGATLNKRWTPSYKQLIMTSRIQSTQSLVDLFSQRNINLKCSLMLVQWVIIHLVYIIRIQKNIKHIHLIFYLMWFISGNVLLNALSHLVRE